MTLENIIQIANETYPDGLIEQAHLQDGTPGVGDGLAEFIARELADTFDSNASELDQLMEAHKCMDVACKELLAVVSSFNNQIRNLYERNS